MYISRNQQIDTDESTGLAVIVETGRCTHDEAAAIEAGCTRRYRVVTVPAASGGVLVALDGTTPSLRRITHTATGRTYTCVKTDGRCHAMSPVQTGGVAVGKAVCRYTIRYQQVGSVA